MSPPESPIELSMTEFDVPTRKRRRRGEPSHEPIIEETTVDDSGEAIRRGEATSPIFADDEHSPDEPSNPDFPVDQDEAMDDTHDHCGVAAVAMIPPRPSRRGWSRVSGWSWRGCF